MIRQFSHRFLLTVLASALALGATGCSNNKGYTPTSTVGTGVVLSASGTTSLTPGGSVILGATVLNDVNNQGVTWSLSGPGTLSAATTTQVTYFAPATLNGTTTATITATSIADTTMTSNASVVTTGTPQLQPQTSLPANQHIGYGTGISVSGGVAPYVWAVVAGQLPPGLALNGSTGGVLGISGTPTALGTWTFTVRVTDANSRVSQGDYTIQVNPQLSCLLSGTFAYKLNGFSKTGAPATRAGLFTVDSNGIVTGVQDLKSDIGTRIGEQVTTGQCQNQNGNHGTITFNSASGQLVFDWAVLASLNDAFMQETDGSGIAGTASLVRVDSSATTAANKPNIAGNYAFGVFGTDAQHERLGMVGNVVIDASGAIQPGGTADANGSLATLIRSPLTGAFTADPVAGHAGRGTLVLHAGGIAYEFVYYVVTGRDGRRIYLMESDNNATSPLLVGDLTPQPVAVAPATPFSSNSFAPAASGTTAFTPAILELWSATGTHYPTSSTALGQFFSASPTSGVDLVLDTATGGSNNLGQLYGSTYAVDPNSGRITISFGSGTAARDIVGYLTGTSTGYVVETTPNVGNGYGFLEAQTGIPYSNFQGGSYLGATILPPAISPIALLATVTVQGGVFGGGLVGQYALNNNTGRGLAVLGRDVFGGSGLVFYILNDSKLVLMGNGANAINSQMGYLFY